LKISQVITNYNQGRFAKDALKSICKQSLLPDEVVIVDDCSIDNSVELIEDSIKYYNKIPSTRLVKTPTNSKPAGARNQGIKSTTGDIICFLDIDDIYYKDKIAKSIEIFNKYPDVGLVYTDYDIWDTKINKVVREFKHPYTWDMLWQTCIVSTNSIVRRSVFDAVGLFDEQLFGPEDYQMWIRIAQKFILYHIPEPLFTYRVHGENLTVKHKDFVIAQTKQLKEDLLRNGYITLS